MTADQPPLSADQLRAALEAVHREALTDVGAAASATATARTLLDEAVGRARAAGASWTEIGRAAGMTRQSARERWSR